jgi:hypothetical protein
MGNPTGRIFFDGYGYGMVLPDGYVPVAIPTARPLTWWICMHNTSLARSHFIQNDMTYCNSSYTSNVVSANAQNRAPRVRR